MKFLCAMFLCFAMATAAFSQAPIPPVGKFTIKCDKTKYTPCRMIKVTADGGVGKTVLWRYDGDLNDTEADGKTFRFVASEKNRTITIKAYTATTDGDVVEAVLIMEPDVYIPPTPPPLPTPVDPLTVDIRKLIKEEDRPQLKKLAALYKLMAVECGKSEYNTATDINNMYRQSATNLVGDVLINVRTRLADEIIAVVADPDTTLTAEVRNSLAAVFIRLSKICMEA